DETVTVSLGTATLDLLAKNISSEGTAFETPSSYPVNIQTTGSWAVTEALTWATVLPPSGRGNAVVNITVQPNTATVSRTGVIKIGGVSHTITQTGTLKPTLGPLVGSPFNAIVGGSFELVIPTVNAPVTYTTTGMPPGLTLSNTTGMITGRPTMTGTVPTTYNVTVRASNTSGPITTDTAGRAAAFLAFTIQVIPLPAGVIGTFHGLIERSSTVNVGTIPNLGARWEMTVSALGAVSGKIVEGVTSRSFADQLEVTAATANSPTISAAVTGTALTLDLKLNALTDSLSSGAGENVLRSAGNSSVVTGWGNAWSTTAPIRRATQFRGPYSFAISNPSTNTATNTAAPDGYGFGNFIISETNGALNITGDLPDGSKILSASFIGQNGEVLLYTPLHGNKGSIHGKLTVTPNNAPTDNSVEGQLTWLKPALLATDKDKSYQSGFGPLTLDAKGSTYLPPAKGQRVLGLPAPALTPTTATNAKLAFTLGGLDLATPNSLAFNQLIRVNNASATGLTNTATVVPFNATTLTNPNKVAITTFTAPTGAFAGNFTLPGIPARIGPFFGQIVRIIGTNTTTQGYGYFLLPSVPAAPQTVLTSPKLSGRVELTAP
ncbi:MAG: BACON domain-containing protein, partial [Verrucomicrobia bacterium]|nr:BACON domain-containing protein [Verrucomicrobiota bacterium]